MDSATTYQEYIDKAVELGQTALGFSEHGNVKEWTAKKVACEKAGLKFIPACEIYLTRSLLQDVDGEPKKIRDNYHTILIAKNYDGLLEMNQLVSMSTDEEHNYYNGRISFDEFLGISDNIISTSACLASPLSKLELDDPYYEKLVQKYTYLEIQPHNCEEQIAYNRHLAWLAEKYHKPLIVGTDAHSVSDYKNECRDILMLYKGQHYDGEDQMDLVYRSYDEICEAFRQQDSIPESLWLEALENTNVMAASVEPFELDTSNKYPILYGTAKKDAEVYTQNIWDSFEEKLKSGVIPKEQEAGFRAALEEEISVFNEIGMAGFMQSESEIIRWCHDNGIVTGPSRGSVSGSRAAYVTDITDVNPETWNTVFSRFANRDRVELGDIDTDVIASDRPKIFEYIIGKFGQPKTARVPSYGTVQDKKAIEIIVGAFRKKWELEHEGEDNNTCPYSLAEQKKLKEEYDKDAESFMTKHKDIAYYFSGLLGIKISQSVHPAGIIISPITLQDHYGTFWKDGEQVIQIDMDSAHDVGLVKYDFLILRNIGIIKDACSLAGIPYPKSHEVDWDDQKVWADMLSSPVGIFQMEGDFAFKLLKDFNPTSIFDMSLVTACIRPSGASYRNDLIARKPHHNDSKIVDDILADNNGYLVYQEDVIKFLQDGCGLSGSEADTVRRGIAKKNLDMLNQMMPKIKDGYCKKSDKQRETAEKEVEEYVQILIDASSYMFGYNHSVSYCLVGYLCAYLRYYYPYEFVTSLLNNAANESDIAGATQLAKQLKISITPPRYGSSSDVYGFNKETKKISKGAASIKHMNAAASVALYQLSHEEKRTFSETLCEIRKRKAADAQQLDILISVDYFQQFGNITELTRILDLVREFKSGETKSYRCAKVGETMKPLIERHASNLKKDGKPGTSYKFSCEADVIAFLNECEELILSYHLDDVSYRVKAANQQEYLGYIALETGMEDDKRKLYVADVYELPNKFRGGVWKYKITTSGLFSGKSSSIAISPVVFNRMPLKKGDIIQVPDGGLFKDNKGYWNLSYYKIVE